MQLEHVQGWNINYIDVNTNNDNIHDMNNVHTDISIIMKSIYNKKTSDVQQNSNNNKTSTGTSNNKNENKSMLEYAMIQCLTISGKIDDISQAFDNNININNNDNNDSGRGSNCNNNSIDISFVTSDIVSLYIIIL